MPTITSYTTKCDLTRWPVVERSKIGGGNPLLAGVPAAA